MQEINKPQYAGFFVRFFAWMIDVCMVGILLLFIKIPVWVSTFLVEENPLFQNVLFQFSIWDIICYLLGVTYSVLMIYYGGATLGKKALKLRVIGRENTLSFLTVLYRETVGKYLSSVILCIGFLLIGIDSQKRGLHDILCDTWVVYEFEDKTKNKNLEKTYMQQKPIIHKEIKEEESEYKPEDKMEESRNNNL